MRHTDDGDLGNRRVLYEPVLDLDAIDVLATTDDHVLRPVCDIEEPVLVEVTEIPRA